MPSSHYTCYELFYGVRPLNGTEYVHWYLLRSDEILAKGILPRSQTPLSLSLLLLILLRFSPAVASVLSLSSR